MAIDYRNSGHVMFQTIQWALQDREAMLDALSDSSDAEKNEVIAEIKAVERLRERLFGNRQTGLEKFYSEAKRVSIAELRKMTRTQDE